MLCSANWLWAIENASHKTIQIHVSRSQSPELLPTEVLTSYRTTRESKCKHTQANSQTHSTRGMVLELCPAFCLQKNLLCKQKAGHACIRKQGRESYPKDLIPFVRNGRKTATHLGARQPCTSTVYVYHIKHVLSTTRSPVGVAMSFLYQLTKPG